MSILEQAQRDLARARSDAVKARDAYRAAVAKLKTAQDRLDKLLITKMEIDIELVELQRRREAAKGSALAKR